MSRQHDWEMWSVRRASCSEIIQVVSQDDRGHGFVGVSRNVAFVIRRYKVFGPLTVTARLVSSRLVSSRVACRLLRYNYIDRGYAE